MAKSRDAFRTISEVAEWLDTPAHVLRFWESRFSQVKPVKRAGGRRYYRPSDMLLLGGIRRLLHDDGITIKGVQKILRERGIRHVIALSEDHLPDLEQPVYTPTTRPVRPSTLAPQEVEEQPTIQETAVDDAAAYLEKSVASAREAYAEDEPVVEEPAPEVTAPPAFTPPPASEVPDRLGVLYARLKTLRNRVHHQMTNP